MLATLSFFSTGRGCWVFECGVVAQTELRVWIVFEALEQFQCQYLTGHHSWVVVPPMALR